MKERKAEPEKKPSVFPAEFEKYLKTPARKPVKPYASI